MVHVEEALAGPARRAHVALEEPIERLEVAAEGDQLRIARLQLEQLRPQAWRGHRVPRLAAPVAVRGEQGALVADAVFLREAEQRFQLLDVVAHDHRHDRHLPAAVRRGIAQDAERPHRRRKGALRAAVGIVPFGRRVVDGDADLGESRVP